MRRFLATALKVAVSLGLVVLFLRRVEWADLRTAFSEVRFDLWILAVVIFAISNLMGSVQWRELLRAQGITLSMRSAASLYFVGVFFNNFLVGNVGGDAVRIYHLKRMTGRGLPGFAATFMDRFIGLFAMICFSVGAYVMSPELWGPALLIPILVLGAVLAGVLSFGFSRRLSGLMLDVVRRMFPARAAGLLEDVRESFMLYRHAYWLLGRVALLVLGVQLCRIGIYYVTGHALGQALGFRNYVVFIPLIAIVAGLPISFGGIGVRENIGVLLFGRVGVGPATAVALMLLGYLAGIVASLPGMIVFVLKRSVAGKGMPAQEGSTSADP